MQDAWSVIHSANPARPETKAAKAYLLADTPDGRQEALKLYESLSAESIYGTWWVRQMASKILLLLGEVERAEQDCRRWMEAATESDAAHIGVRLDKASIEYLAKKDRVAEDYLQANTWVDGLFYANYNARP
jgi:hypothetical protein